MGKSPAFQFYPGDWRRDTQVQMASMSTRGVWIEMLCCMWDAPERGKLVGTIGEISRLIGCDGLELVEALRQIERLKIGNVEGLECYKNVTCNADVTKCNGVVTVINRRMYREETTRKQTRKRVSKHREEKKKQDCNADVTPPSSSSSSISSSKEEKINKKEEILLERFNRFWQAYPKKKSKGQALKTWMKIKPSEQLLETMLSAIERAKTSVEWTKENGRYIPYPSTWLNAMGWEDEFEPIKQTRYAT